MAPRRRRNARAGLIVALIVAFLLGNAASAFADTCATQPIGQPTLPELRRAARRHAGLDSLPTWRGRARTSALLPDVTLRASRALNWDDGGVDTGVPTEVGKHVVFEARLSWRLERLVFEPTEPRLHDVERASARARNSLDADVTRLYFQWRRALLAADTGDPAKLLDAEEAWAQLDARTGGWLSRRGCPP